MKRLIAILVFIPMIPAIYSACTTTDERPEYEAARVIERMDGHDETPKFATGSKVMWTEGSNVFFANIVSMSGNSRPEACMKAASVDAKVEMLKYIKENITTSGQLNEASAEDDPAFESLTAFLSQGKISGAAVDDRYWDRREESAVSGERLLRLRCAVTVKIEKRQLAKQLRDATRNAPKGNPEVREKLLNAQKDFIDNLGN